MIREVKWRNDKNSTIIQQSFISDRKLFYTKVVSKWPIDVGTLSNEPVSYQEFEIWGK